MARGFNILIALVVLFALLFFLTPLMESQSNSYLPSFIDTQYLPMVVGAFFILLAFFVLTSKK